MSQLCKVLQKCHEEKWHDAFKPFWSLCILLGFVLPYPLSRVKQSTVMENWIGLGLFILEKMQAALGKYKFKFFNKKDWIHQSTLFPPVSHLVHGFLWKKNWKNPYITLWKNAFSINKSAMVFFTDLAFHNEHFYFFFRTRILISIPISFSISWKILLQCSN